MYLPRGCHAHSVSHSAVQGGNSRVVRLPAHLAFPPATKLTLARVDEKIIVAHKAETLNGFVDFLCTVGRQHDGQRVDLDILERDGSAPNIPNAAKALTA